MSTKNENDLTPDKMQQMSKDEDALKTITTALRVREMGPADHIRTKHQVKAWLEGTGDLAEAEKILAVANERRQLQENSVRQANTERRDHSHRSEI